MRIVVGGSKEEGTEIQERDAQSRKVLGDGFSELQKGLWRLLGKRGKWRNCGSGEEEITDAQLAWRGHRLPAQELALFRYLILVRFTDRVERD